MTFDLYFNVTAGIDIIYSAVINSLHIGTSSFKNGKLLKRTAPTYIDLLKIPPIANDTKRAKTIGKNKLTFSVVSSIITANENDNLEYPARTLAAPIIAYVDG